MKMAMRQLILKSIDDQGRASYMPILTTIEKRYFEDLFSMGSGYVLDFSNLTFAEFFRENIGVDIYDDEYAFNGDSKAKRLRAFWEIESRENVTKTLEELLEVWVFENRNNIEKHTNKSYIKCREIVNNLLGVRPTKEVDEENQFLKQSIQVKNIEKLDIESSVILILSARLQEAERCYKSKAWLSVIFLSGSILEGALLGKAQKNPKDFNSSSISPKDNFGKVKPFHEWSLAQFIDVSCDIGVLKEEIKKFGHGLRDFRNYIHPYQQMLSGYQPDKHTAKICLQVLKAAIASLCGER